MTRIALALLLLCLTPMPGEARTDPRIRTVAYTQNAVIPLTGHFGFQMAIEFNDDETIENVAIGDSVSWQVTPNRRGDVVFLKPIDRALPTNMTVVTTMRRYTFALDAQSAVDAALSDMIFVLRFNYPKDPEPIEPEVDVKAELRIDKPTVVEPADVNKNYTYTGAREIIPSRIFDDGRSTYFQWPSSTPTPAIFLIRGDGAESVVNHGFIGDYIVVDRVAERFLLRLGDLTTVIYNEAFTPVDPGPDAPTPRPERRGLFGKVFGGKGEVRR